MENFEQVTDRLEAKEKKIIEQDKLIKELRNDLEVKTKRTLEKRFQKAEEKIKNIREDSITHISDGTFHRLTNEELWGFEKAVMDKAIAKYQMINNKQWIK